MAACGGSGAAEPPASTAQPEPTLALPAPTVAGEVSLEEALAQRRSVRDYGDEALGWAEVGQLLWAAQGRTQQNGGGRTAPSAGGTYPLEVFALTAEGVFRYLPEEHAVEVAAAEDRRRALQEAALGQEWVGRAPLVLVVVGVVERTAERYGGRAERYVILEAGHAAQNILLQAVALGLGAVPVGAFDDGAVRRVLAMSASWTPLYIIPVGRPAGA